MLFKNELPPPRYTLDGDVGDEEVTVETKYTLTPKLPDVTGSDVLFLAPRCASLASSLGGSALGTVHLVAETRPKDSKGLLNAIVDDFYEVEASSEDFVSTQQWTVAVRRGPSNWVVIVLPVLGEAEAAHLGHELITLLKPARTVLATPGSSFMSSDICYLGTHNFDVESIKDVPRAEPPVIVQGAGAAAISSAKQQDIPALALVVSADGPANHEIVSSLGMAHLRNALFKALNLKSVSEPQVERGISGLYF